jgi:hypothetical protein
LSELKLAITTSRKTNRDHAKKKHRPIVEDEVIAEQLEKLLTPAITNQENYYRKLIKQKRKPNVKLIVAPFPDLQRGSDEFFFNNYPKTA